MTKDQAEDHATPSSLLDLFISFTLISLQGFGGVVAIIQRELVEKKRWLAKEQFIEDWAVAQIMPGPNVVNLALMFGARHFGWRGALAALAGMLLVPLMVVLVLGMLYSAFVDHPGVVGATRGMSAVAAGLIIATGLKLFDGLKSNPLGKLNCFLFGALCFVLIGVLHWPLLSVLCMLGPLACFIAYRRMKS